MIGLEIAAAVFGIIAGIASATKMITDLRKIYAEKKKSRGSATKTVSKAIEQRLQRLEKQLKASEKALLKHQKINAGQCDRLPNNAFQACNTTLESIVANLRQINTISPDIALQAPETLNLHALEQLLDRWRTETDRMVQIIASIKQEEGSRILVPSPSASSGSSNLCPSAVLYCNNQWRFDEVAVSRQCVGGIQEWACKLCGTIVSRASTQLILEKSGSVQIYIAPVGFFKGHNGNGVWSCIWQRRLKECSEPFNRKRDLLRHMQDIHVKNQGNNGMYDVDLPADGRGLNAAKCGYGVSLAGEEMRIVKGRFMAM